MNKYRNKKVIVTADGTMFETDELKRYNITDIQGIKFDSKMEANFYLHILQREKDGYYKLVSIQPSFTLQDKPKIVYKADFTIEYPNGETHVIDVKGMQTQAFRLKSRMFRAVFPHLKLQLVTMNRHQWEFKEIS